MDASFMADECTGDVSVSVKAQELIVTQHINAVGGRIHIRDVGPGLGLSCVACTRTISLGECAGKERGEATFLFFGKLLSRPHQGIVSCWVHPCRIVFSNGFLIMVAAHGGNLAAADEFKAFGQLAL